MPKIADDARPRLAHGVRLQLDRATGKSVLLFPEGIIELNETAQDILNRCDGRSLNDIASGLAEEYDADPTMLASDVREILTELATRKLVEFL